MARSIPTTTSHVPGDLMTGRVWNNGPKALNDFLVNRPTFLGQQGAGVSVSSGTWTAIQMSLNFIDTDGGHNVAVNNTRYTCQVPGWYWVVGMIAWNTSGGSAFRVENALAKNGSIWAGSSQFLSIVTGQPSAMTCSALIQLAAGDYVEVWGRQNTGSTFSFDNESISDGVTRTCICMMSATWIRS